MSVLDFFENQIAISEPEDFLHLADDDVCLLFYFISNLPHKERNSSICEYFCIVEKIR
jgi:hypothetical protein